MSVVKTAELERGMGKNPFVRESKEPKREEAKEAKSPFGKRKTVEAKEGKHFKSGGKVKRGC